MSEGKFVGPDIGPETLGEAFAQLDAARGRPTPLLVTWTIGFLLLVMLVAIPASLLEWWRVVSLIRPLGIVSFALLPFAHLFGPARKKRSGFVIALYAVLFAAWYIAIYTLVHSPPLPREELPW